MNKKGFTLIELLAVLVILGLLVMMVSSLVSDTVNKAKEDINASQENAIISAAEMWSIDNSDSFDDTEAQKTEFGLDVVFLIDISASMVASIPGSAYVDGARTARYYAAVDAVNVALGLLENDNNRQAVVLYGGGFYNFMPLGSYSSASKKYIYMKLGNQPTDEAYSTNKFMTNSDLKKDGVPYSKTQGFHTGTRTQEAFYHVAEMLESLPDSQTFNRIPVIILLTDGVPYGHNVSKCKSCSQAALEATGLSGADIEVYYYTMMAGYETKDRLEKKYYGSPAYIYTVGLGVSATEYVKKTFEPNTYAATRPYNYVTESFISSSMSPQDLKLIFEEISVEVVDAVNVTQVCVSLKDLHEQGYLNKNDIDLEVGDMESNYVMINYNETTNQYQFMLATTEAQKNACKLLINK